MHRAVRLRMIRPSLLACAGVAHAVLSGCTLGERALHGCPAGETCSDVTPAGLRFFGAGLAGELSFGPPDTAIGGTQRVALAHAYDDGAVPLTGGYTATIEGAPALVVDGTQDEVVSLRGVEPGEAYLRIVDGDGLLMDRKLFGSAPVASTSIVGTRLESSRLPVAFLAGTIRVGVALHATRPEDPSQTYRIVDESMTLELAGAERVTWDTLELRDAAVGTVQVTVTAGELPPTTLDIEVVAGVDELVDHLSAPLVVGQPGSVCFDARSGTRHVTGLAWTFASDNGTADSFLADNCVIVWPERAGTIAVTGSAGGHTRTAVYPVAAGAAEVRDEAALGGLAADATAGERALARSLP